MENCGSIHSHERPDVCFDGLPKVGSDEADPWQFRGKSSGKENRRWCVFSDRAPSWVDVMCRNEWFGPNCLHVLKFSAAAGMGSRLNNVLSKHWDCLVLL